MFDRPLLGVLIPTVALSAACSKNDGRSPGILEGVANDVENEIDGAGNTVDGVGHDVTDTLDGTSPTPAPQPSGAAQESDAPATEESKDEAPSGE